MNETKICHWEIISESKYPESSSGWHKKSKKIYLIGIWGIWVSALARYYASLGYTIFGSDAHDSQLIHSLQSEGMDIIIGSDKTRITWDIEKIIYSEAVPFSQSEMKMGQDLWIPMLKYTQALWEVVNTHKLIAVSGTHGKSTTSSLIAQIFKNAGEDFSAVIGTLLKEFDGKNFFSQGEKEYFIIEACEYKEHFLEYRPLVWVITNIEYDHADYYKTPESYVDAFEKFIENILPGGFCILGEDKNSLSLLWKRKDIHYITVKDQNFEILSPGGEMQTFPFPGITLKIPGEHVLYDAKCAYIAAHLAGISDEVILTTLREYSGVWRRMEIIGTTENGNILMSDYWHHPTEIGATLKALKSWYPEKKILLVFQPHQYSRTLELLEDFRTCFFDADTVIIPNIYESRDSEEDKKKINTEKLVSLIQHESISNGQGLENTLKLIEKYDSEHPNSSIILLQGAGNIDTLRYKIKTH